MSDYIKRDDAIEAIARYTNDCFGTFDDALLNAEDIVLDAVPSADVIERKQGKWVETKYTDCGATIYMCSVCAHEVSDIYVRNFCPNCGVDMRGDE